VSDTPDQWEDLVERTRALLRAVAAAGGTIGYEEVRAHLLPFHEIPQTGPGDLAAVLRAASEAEEAAGVGLVSAVVVRPAGRPGGGWFRLAEAHGRDVSDPDVAWRTERERLRRRLAR
jgi:hypothetical protein